MAAFQESNVEKGLYQRDFQMGILSNRLYANKHDRMPTEFCVVVFFHFVLFFNFLGGSLRYN